MTIILPQNNPAYSSQSVNWNHGAWPHAKVCSAVGRFSFLQILVSIRSCLWLNMFMQKTAIIGAGITGLTAAFELKRQGLDCTVYEASDRVGGVIRTVQEEGFLVECGPNSILDTHPDLGKLIARLGLEGNKLPANTAAQNRFIVRDGQPIALPTSPPAFFSSKAFSGKAKLRLLREPFIRSKSNESESLADFVLRRLGQEFLDYAINPFVGGVYAGDPAKLSTAHAFPKLYELEQKYGSLIKGAIKGAKERKKREEVASKDARMFTFDDGMEVLPRTAGRKTGRRRPAQHARGMESRELTLDGGG